MLPTYVRTGSEASEIYNYGLHKHDAISSLHNQFLWNYVHLKFHNLSNLRALWQDTWVQPSIYMDYLAGGVMS